MMPSDTRALTRAARARAQADGIRYTEARERELLIKELLDEGEFESRAEADAYVSDPRNQVMCHTCGWTNGMVCPECPRGCGCTVGCTGWRHTEWADPGDDDPEDREVDCGECGGSYDGRTGYGCACSGD